MENNNDQPKKASKWEYGALVGIVAFVTALAGTAQAQAASVTDMATTAASDLTPIILGVGGALVAVAVVRFGVRWVLSAIGRGGKA